MQDSTTKKDYNLFDVSFHSIPQVSALIDELYELIIKIIAFSVVIYTAAIAGLTEIKHARSGSHTVSGN
jgi:hypothetical protein